ncbi:MAG: gfo/Idh/MocA family oxidoreductase [Planctomycetota bacterium]|nr:MAG: gfo/Idh/MocA family oxidoreductase [Planctomycetota bacterium]
MSAQKPLRVAIIGLGFGAEFIPIYQNYPSAEMYAICRRDTKGLNEAGDKYNIAVRYTDYQQVLDDPNIDAVHINSPIPDHGWMSVAALKAGKHVACTVPMGTSVEECRAIVEAQRASGKVYMMMETVVYSREYLYVKDLYDKGVLGRLQFLRGSHMQDMDGWPNYWPGLPPMWYATHCVSPCLAIVSEPGKPAHADSVVCHGSGRISEELIGNYGSPFAIESATFKIKGSDVVAEVTRSLFDTARQYRESFDAYGSKASFEWQLAENQQPLIHTKSSTQKPIPEPEIAQETSVPDFARLLPEGIQKFTMPAAIQDADHLSFLQGGGHGGSHPHLVHAFVQAVLGHKAAFPDAETSANWTMVGICAHESAMSGGDRVDIPNF